MKEKNCKKITEKKAQVKRTLVNGIIVTSVIIFVILLLIVMAVYFVTRNENGEVSYPESPLTKMMNQPYSYIRDEKLDIQLQLPSVPVIMNVGGTERFVSEEGCVFRYNNDFSISVYELTKSVYDILSTEFAANLYNGEISGEVTYIPETMTLDVGYFNAFPAEYQCGVIQISDVNNVIYRNIYVLTLVLDTGADKKVMISVCTADMSKLYEAEILLESIGYTVMDISITWEVLADDEKIIAERKENVSVRVEEELEEEELKETEEIQTMTDNSGVGFEYINIEIPLLKQYENGAVVVLQYTNVDADISKLLVRNTDNSIYQSADVSSYGGLGFFALWDGKKGNYTMQIPADVDLGIYSARVLGYDEFIEQYGAVLSRP